jgi:hypothetical protein
VGLFADRTRRGHETSSHRRWVAFFAAALAAVMLLEPAAAQRSAKPAPQKAPRPPAARKERPVPFAVGETLTFDVSWSSYVTAGSATMTVSEKKPSYGSVAYYIAAQGQPGPLLSRLYDLFYKADTLLDVYSLLPQRGSVFSKEGRRQRMKITMFDHTASTASYEVHTRTIVKKDLRIPAYSQDPLGAIYVLRALALKAGDRFSVPICDAGETFKVDVTVATPEPVKSGIGDVRAWKITPTLPKAQSSGARRLTLWISDDARRLPVKMQAQLAVGTFDLTLRSVGK